MSFRAVGDRVLVRPDKPESKTPGGIVIPEHAADKPTTGTVVSVTNYDDDKFILDVGSRVVYGQYAGSDVVVDGEDLRIIRKDEIFLVGE